MLLHTERGRELHVDSYCFRAPYVAALLQHGLAVSDANVHIGSGNVAWTLGALLLAAADILVQGIESSVWRGTCEQWQQRCT